MADAEIVETPPAPRPIRDFDPELSAVVRREFGEFKTLEDLLLRREEKGLLDGSKEHNPSDERRG